jgi:radical SAM protein with 4Fe4S-binding SPASM domain
MNNEEKKEGEKKLVEDAAKIGPMLTINKFGKMVCRHPWTSMDLQPDGDVQICCYLPKRIVGNVKFHGVKGVWNSEEFQDFRKQMSEKGAKAVCPKCHVLQGIKQWETLNWYKDLDPNSEVYKNAKLNEEEIFEGKTVLASNPRRIKYIPSFVCNLNCYHCNQEQYRIKGFHKLERNIFNQVMEIFQTLQVINPFGGEPFIFPETIEFMRAIVEKNPACRFYTTTNANHFTDEIIDLLSKIKIMKMAVSYDGYTKETYEKYRPGASWETVLKNTEILSKMREKNPFPLVLNASFNNETYKQMPILLEMCKKYKAASKMVPLHIKSNHDKEFWRKHVKMSKRNLNEWRRMVDEALLDKDLHLGTRNSLLNMKMLLENYPYSEFQIAKNRVKVYIIDLFKKVGLYNAVRPLYKKITGGYVK